MTAAEARRNTDLRARVRLSVRAGDRALKDLLDGYEAESMTATRLRAALAAEGVDLATIPQRTDADVQAWKRRRQPRLASAHLDGYAAEKCDCGRDYPRLQTEATGICPKCWRRRAERAEHELISVRAENEDLQERLANVTRPVLSSLPGGKTG